MYKKHNARSLTEMATRMAGLATAAGRAVILNDAEAAQAMAFFGMGMADEGLA